ncbi:hypothetical protein [Rhodopila sp.]|uniref:hypothetical protein n=1 Tax=Rhodopila sp. TaxID=2480087 RepID=UPI002B6DA7FC|nr:hypothetical protein [Rhodopila sp.]HVZ08347.1 hypothetical protein [Rhodopila sp.]
MNDPGILVSPQIAPLLALTLQLFLPLTQGDGARAMDLAGAALREFSPRTIEELRTAQQIVGFGTHAMLALADAMNPELSPMEACRCRASAAAMLRSERAARRLLASMRPEPADKPDHDAAKPGRPASGMPAPAMAARETAAAAVTDSARSLAPAGRPGRQGSGAASQVPVPAAEAGSAASGPDGSIQPAPAAVASSGPHPAGSHPFGPSPFGPSPFGQKSIPPHPPRAGHDPRGAADPAIRSEHDEMAETARAVRATLADSALADRVIAEAERTPRGIRAGQETAPPRRLAS